MNCIIVDDDDLSINVLKFCITKTGMLNLIGSSTNATDALELVKSKNPDLIFLDVEMPDVSGIDLISLMPVKPLIIFVTSNKEYALEAFNHDAEDFLLKPVSYPRFLKAVLKAKESFENKGIKPIVNASDNSLFIKVDNKLLKIKTDEISYIEALADYVNIYLGSKVYTVHSTMKRIENILPSNDFIRIHRSFIIKLDEISEIQNNSIRIDKKLIPIGKLYKNELMKRLNLV